MHFGHLTILTQQGKMLEHLGEAVANILGFIQHHPPPVHGSERAVDHVVALGAAQGTPLTRRVPCMVYLLSCPSNHWASSGPACDTKRERAGNLAAK